MRFCWLNYQRFDEPQLSFVLFFDCTCSRAKSVVGIPLRHRKTTSMLDVISIEESYGRNMSKWWDKMGQMDCLIETTCPDLWSNPAPFLTAEGSRHVAVSHNNRVALWEISGVNSQVTRELGMVNKLRAALYIHSWFAFKDCITSGVRCDPWARKVEQTKSKIA